MRSSILALLALTAVAQSPPPATFHAETRLVEVEVVVRDKHVRPPGAGAFFRELFDSGPPYGPPGVPIKGLTKDDFTLLDQGQPQPIAVFRAGSAGAGSSDDTKLVALPPGAVSNRTDHRGQALNGATVVLADLLNTSWDLSDYARQGLIDLLRSLSETDSRIAVYSLGENLHILHDFTDDPQKLLDIAAGLENRTAASHPDLAGALRDYGDLLALIGPEVAADVHGKITVKAVKRIIDHLSGVPGRKNLIWLAQIDRLPPTVTALLQRANVVLYPVMVRCPVAPGAPCGFARPESQYAIRGLGTAFGGRGFFDAKDLTFALLAAEEDHSSSYVLGYYPTEDMLDGTYHRITVKLHDKTLDTKAFDVHYRSGYLATRVAVPTPPPTLAELMDGPLNAAGIGLTGQATPQAQHPGFYDVSVKVDLRDIKLDHKDGRFTGAFAWSVPNPSTQGTVKTGTIAVDLADAQLALALENGYTVIVSGTEAESGEIRVVVRDRAGGAAGSLSIPIDKPAESGRDQIQ